MSVARIVISGSIHSEEDADALIEAIELGCMDIDGEEHDARRAVDAAISSGGSLWLVEDDPRSPTLHRFQAELQRIGLSYTLSFEGRGTRWSETWIPGMRRPTRAPVDQDGIVQIPAQRAAELLERHGAYALMALVEDARVAAGETRAPALAAAYEPVAAPVAA